jgi:hypothetical protein
MLGVLRAIPLTGSFTKRENYLTIKHSQNSFCGSKNLILIHVQ